MILTGDGAGFSDGIGFHSDLERMFNKGWGIEAISWDAACSKKLKEWAKEVGIYVPLDKYYDSITFIERGRQAKALVMRHRGRAVPKKQ